ncbi:MAG: hypothetical protein ACP5OU_02790 [Methanothrix sp.]
MVAVALSGCLNENEQSKANPERIASNMANYSDLELDLRLQYSKMFNSSYGPDHFLITMYLRRPHVQPRAYTGRLNISLYINKYKVPYDKIFSDGYCRSGSSINVDKLESVTFKDENRISRELIWERSENITPSMFEYNQYSDSTYYEIRVNNTDLPEGHPKEYGVCSEYAYGYIAEGGFTIAGKVHSDKSKEEKLYTNIMYIPV